MTYKEKLKSSMEGLAQDPLNRFIGYGVKIGGRALGTLVNVPELQLIETPVAENLMMGLAIGMSLAGLKPVVYFERADFMLNAADAIVNHLDKAMKMSLDEFSPAVIIRVTVGNKAKPLFTGETHTQNFAEAFNSLVNFTAVELFGSWNIDTQYHAARQRQNNGKSTMLFEFKDLA